jgi:hypothetical protein
MPPQTPAIFLSVEERVSLFTSLISLGFLLVQSQIYQSARTSTTKKRIKQHEKERCAN